MINLDEVALGDQVTIRDQTGNLVIGKVEGEADRRWVKAFDTSIPFARLNKTGRWVETTRVRVVAHLPAMF